MHFSSSRILASIFVLSATLYLLEVGFGLPNRDITWAFDANPLYPLIVAKRVFLDGWNTGFHGPYPNFHHILLLFFIAPYLTAQWAIGGLDGMQMGGGYPYGIAEFDLVFMHLALLTRVVSILMAMGMTYWVYLTGKAVASSAVGLYAASLAAFSPAVTYYVHTETLDIPMLFWVSGGIYFFVRATQTTETKYYVGLAVMAALATATKDYAYGAFVLLPLPLVAVLARKLYGGVTPTQLWAASVNRRHLTGLLVFLISFVLAENLLWNPAGFINHVKVASGMDLGSYAGPISTELGRHDLISADRLLSVWVILRFILGWVGVIVCLIGMVLSATHRNAGLRILIWPVLGLYVFTYVQVSPDYSRIDRPLLGALPMLAVFGGAFLQYLTVKFRRYSIGLLVSIALTLGCVLNAAAVDFTLVKDARYQAEEWIARNVPYETTILLVGRRIDVPRLDRRWRSLVISHQSLDNSDIVIGPGNDPEILLRRSKPDFVVVASAFRNQFSGVSEEPREDSLAENMRQFFRRMDSGDLGYAEVVVLVPPFADILKFPRYMRGEIVVYAIGRAD